MRKFLLAATALAVIAVPTLASAQYYSAPYGAPAYTTPYGAPGVVVTPGPAPMVDGQVYLAPGQTYVQPGEAYSDQPIFMNGQRYYRDCWWDWGQRRCELKPWH